MFLPLYVISRVSLLYLLPSQISQEHICQVESAFRLWLHHLPEASHLPPFTLKLNLPGEYPRDLILVSANNSHRGIFQCMSLDLI